MASQMIWKARFFMGDGAKKFCLTVADNVKQAEKKFQTFQFEHGITLDYESIKYVGRLDRLASGEVVQALNIE